MVRQVEQLRESLLYVSYSIFKDLITNFDDWEVYRYQHSAAYELWTGTPEQIYRTLVNGNGKEDFDSLDIEPIEVETEDDAIALIEGTEPPESVLRSVVETVSGSSFDFYPIPEERRLTIESFSGGSEDDAKISLYLDPVGNSDEDDYEIIRVGYVEVSNFSFDLNTFFEGDGNRQIVLEAENIGGGGREVAAFWNGILE